MVKKGNLGLQGGGEGLGEELEVDQGRVLITGAKQRKKKDCSSFPLRIKHKHLHAFLHFHVLPRGGGVRGMEEKTPKLVLTRPEKEKMRGGVERDSRNLGRRGVKMVEFLKEWGGGGRRTESNRGVPERKAGRGETINIRRTSTTGVISGGQGNRKRGGTQANRGRKSREIRGGGCKYVLVSAENPRPGGEEGRNVRSLWKK